MQQRTIAIAPIVSAIRLFGLIAAVLVPLTASLGSAQAVVPGTGQLVRPPIPSLPRQAAIRPLELESIALVGDVSIDTLGKQLRVHWSFDDSAGVRQFHSDLYDLAYWPTAAAHLNDGRLTQGSDLLVCGKRPSNGSTVMERWHFVMSGPPGEGSSPTVQKTVVYDQKIAGQQVAKMMHPVNGAIDKVFVHYRDSKDLYVFNAATGTHTLMLTAAQANQLNVEEINMMWSGKTAPGVYVYVYQSDFSRHDGAGLVLYDNQGDGVFEAWVSFDESQWDAVEAIELIERYDA